MISLILFTIFWLPIVIVSLDNTSWDLRFWQNIDYKTQNLIDHLRHGWEPGHRQPLLLAVKFIAFLLVAIFVIDNTSLLPILGAALAYGLWINQSFDILAYRIRHGHKGVSYDRRSILAFVISILLGAILPALITLAILNLRTGNSLLEQLGGWLPNYSSQGFVLAPDVYLYLVLTSMIMLIVDLCSPLITLVSVLITSPFSYLVHQLEISRAINRLSNKQELVKILIVGTSGKSTTSKLLGHLLSSQYNVVQNKYAYPNALTLAKTINRDLRSNTDVLISEIQVSGPADLDKIMNLITPQIIVCTGFSNLESEYWGTYQTLVTKYRQLFSCIPQNGRLILNKDSEIATEITSGLEIPIIYCSGDSPNVAYHQNAIDYYRLVATAKGNEVEMTMHTYNFDVPFVLPSYYQNYLYSTLLSIATANELGVTFADSIHMLGFFPIQKEDFAQIPGDNNTVIWFHSGKPKVQTLRNICAALPTESNHNLLIISGIKELAAPNLLDKSIPTKLQQKFHTIITTDKQLAKILRADNIHSQVFTVSNASKATYLAREHMQSGDNIAILGNWEPKVLNSLKADD